ncbi:MAG TPA: S8 family serine peptidase [Bacteroidia bacterium]|nr:S8 family serine peptidase [Bacteroidia bacterium]
MKTTHLKSLSLLIALGSFSFASAQQMSNPAKNWQNESYEKDSVYGTGSDMALETLKGRKSTTVIVAVIDGGVQINHPALKNHIWTNSKEIAGNKKDDDKNGYVDDVHGWDFIGGKDSDINHENLEVTRLYRDYSKKYANVLEDKVPKADTAEYHLWLKVKKAYETAKNDNLSQLNNFKSLIDTMNMVKTALGKKDFDQADMDSYNPTDSAMVRAKRRLVRNFKRFAPFMKGLTADSIVKLLKPAMDHYSNALAYNYNLDFNPRYLVGDNYQDATQRYYGNNDVIGPTDFHGTHVSGIISADRTGKPGAQEGIADNVQILVVRVVPDGDERDKDVANGIRYAVDNGAKIINMSFGKPYPYNKKTVDEAVKYAEAHDVLLVHAAGNDHNNNDSIADYPNCRYEGTNEHASNWIEVGASDVKGRPATFSNYGAKNVDLFAPGVKIYSTVPDTNYAYLNGTSMATPCVAGVAAIIREYFPKLTAKQVKEILMESVRKMTDKIHMPGHPTNEVTYSDLCVSGGLIDANKAVQLAMKMERGK